MSRHSDQAIDQHNGELLTVMEYAHIHQAIEPVALSMIVRGLVDRITALERTQHEMKARIRELEEPYNP